MFASALTKQRIFKVLELAKETYLNRTTKVSTAKLNEEMLPIIEATPPPSNKGKYIKIKYCMQLPSTRVPSFVFFANLPQYVKEPYKRFLRTRYASAGTSPHTDKHLYPTEIKQRRRHVMPPPSFYSNPILLLAA